MKHRGEHRYAWGEGWLAAAALGMVLLLSLAVYWVSLPREVQVLPVHAVDVQALRRAEMVNINAVDADELASLPGIGDGLAERIIKYRMENGSFAAIEDIMNVPGIGEGTFEAVRDLIYIDET